MPFIHKTNNSYYFATIQQLGGVCCFHKPKDRSMSLLGSITKEKGTGYGLVSLFYSMRNMDDRCFMQLV